MFEFAWPWVFALAPLPWLLRLVLPAADSGEAALKVSFLDELESLAGRRARARLPAWRQQVRFALLWFLLLLAAARPQWVGEPLPLPASGRDLLLAVDVSGSMDYRDMRWQDDEISRLELIKKLFGDFIEDRRGDRVGLILFGSQAYLQAPLTFDRHTVRVWLDEAQIGIAGKNTAIGDAIGLAVKRLRQRPAESRVLVLITDGANTGGQIAPQIAAQLAAEQQVKIYTIGVGADPQQGGVPGLFGFNPGLDLDEPTLRGIAEITGGEYFRARSSAELESISATLDRLEPVAQQTTRARPALALYSWPLAAALGLSVLLVALELWPRKTGPGRAAVPGGNHEPVAGRLAALAAPLLAAAGAAAWLVAVEAAASPASCRTLATAAADGLPALAAGRRRRAAEPHALDLPRHRLAAGPAGLARAQLAATGTALDEA